MKKNVTRFASVGGILVLGACALALAQHDSRNRDREPIRPEPFTSQPAAPIAVDAEWTPPFESAQANAEENTERNSFRLSDDPNPLREEFAGGLPPSLPAYTPPAISQPPGTASRAAGKAPAVPAESQVGQALPELPNSNSLSSGVVTSLVAHQLPQDPPAWVNESGISQQPALYSHSLSDLPAANLPEATPAKPPQVSTSPRSTPAVAAPLANGGTAISDKPSAGSNSESQLPQMPSRTLPPAAQTNPPSGSTLPSGSNLPSGSHLPSGLPQPALGPPTGVGNQAQTSAPGSSRLGDLSDIQRPAFPATNMLPGQSANESNTRSSGSSDAGPGMLPLPNAMGANPTAGGRSLGAGNAVPPASSPQASAGIAARGSAPNPFPPSYTNDRNELNVPSLGAPPTAMTAGGSNAPSMPRSGAPTASALTARATLISSQPGSRYLDGSQAPSMLIQKRAPEEIQVGQKATFTISIRNAGTASAHEVTVVDRVPQGMSFVESIPATQPDASGNLTWTIGEVAAGEERTITLQMVPSVEGELGSVAVVHFAAQASVRTVVTLPKLELALQTSPDVLIGDLQDITVTVRNTGTGVARMVRLEADIPQTLKHESGDPQLEAMLGDLRPNETRNIKLGLRAVQPGQAPCLVRAVSEDGISAEQTQDIHVRSPQLMATIDGPKVRYLERQATFQIAIRNTGTAAASNLDFQLHLPSGLKFNGADAHGQYDPGTHTVKWGLHELAAGQSAPIEVTVLPVELGPQVLSFAASGDLGISAEAQSELTVNGLAELAFTLSQDHGTIEAAATETYSVEVANVGTRPDRDVQLAVELPAGAELVAVIAAPVEHQAQKNQLVFAPIPEMRSNDRHVFRFQVRHTQPGIQIVRTKLRSANIPTPVVKEEDTLVYNDQN